MAGKTDIMNLALVSFLGSDRMMEENDSSKEASLMKLIYTPLVEKLQREYAWNFCNKSAKLTPLTSKPLLDYRYTYQLPVDLGVLVSVGDFIEQDAWTDYDPRLVTALYRIEGRQLLTDLPPPLSLRYRAKVTDTAKFDPAFTDALACMLAVRSCKSVTGKDTLVTSLLEQFEKIISGAILANVIEKPSEKMPASTWMASRL